jgi:cytochrome c oxidase subunit 2
VGLQLTKRARRTALGSMVAVSLLLLGACDSETDKQLERWAMPGNSPGTEQGEHIASLWHWSWVAALITGAIVWALIFYACWRYRRRSDDEIPVQTRYNLPLEIFYTVAPIMMVVVFFFWTVKTQNTVLEHDPEPDHVVQVVGQQWSWTFNYNQDPANDDGPVLWTSGTASQIPTLVLEEGATTEFRLSSPDVIHSFWITGFLMKMDVIPGQAGEDRNSFQVTPKEAGSYKGKCTELCGVSHSRMLFNVEVMETADYDAYMQRLEAAGNTADQPLLGGEHARLTSFERFETENQTPGGHE